MKEISKLSAVFIVSAIIIIFSSCGSNDSKTSSTDSTKVANHSDEHIFACPMHPEVTGKEGDICPKCGMKLEHNDNAGTSGSYAMKFTAIPATIEANKAVTLSFVPQLKGKENEQVALDVEHEKKIHLIVVSDDLSYFDHIHPEMNADGSYTVNHTFPAGGNYKLYADYKPSGANHTVDKIDVKVAGTPPVAKSFSGNKLSGTSDKYSFTLQPTGGKFVTGVLMHINGIVKKDGKEIDANTLDNYLGAKAHMVLISNKEKEYLHVHPDIANGKFDLHTTLESPGIYRGWVQFNADNKIHTIDFTIDVTEGTEQDREKMNKAHSNFHTEKKK